MVKTRVYGTTRVKVVSCQVFQQIGSHSAACLTLILIQSRIEITLISISLVLYLKNIDPDLGYLRSYLGNIRSYLENIRSYLVLDNIRSDLGNLRLDLGNIGLDLGNIRLKPYRFGRSEVFNTVTCLCEPPPPTPSWVYVLDLLLIAHTRRVRFRGLE